MPTYSVAVIDDDPTFLTLMDDVLTEIAAVTRDTQSPASAGLCTHIATATPCPECGRHPGGDMHNPCTRPRTQPLTNDERALQQAEELAIAREELAAFKDGLDASYGAYGAAAAHPSALALIDVLRQTIAAVSAVERRRTARCRE
jgi:hypothetical protein